MYQKPAIFTFYCVGFCVRLDKNRTTASHSHTCSMNISQMVKIEKKNTLSSARPLNYIVCLFASLSMHMQLLYLFRLCFVHFRATNAVKNENSLSAFENVVHEGRIKKTKSIRNVRAMAFNPKSGRQQNWKTNTLTTLSNSMVYASDCSSPLGGNSNLPPNHQTKRLCMFFFSPTFSN